MKKGQVKEFLGVGRRKSAVSSVRLRKGKGKVDVNGSSLEEYFSDPLLRETLLAPMQKFASLKDYDMIIRLKGGGIVAQGIATRLGISRALVQENEDLRSDLKNLGYLTRDPRKKERKKYGLAGARKKFQFSKR